MKKTQFLLTLFLSLFLIIPSYGEIENVRKVISDVGNNSTMQNLSYYREFNSSWFVIKFSSDQKIYIDQLYIEFTVKNSTRNSFFYYILFEKNGTILLRGGLGVFSDFYNDFFFHLNFGFLNITIDEINRENFSGMGGSYEYEITLSPGIYYLVGMHANHLSCKFRVWMNATNIPSIETTEGNETYLLDETNFLGKLNIYSFNHSIMLKGSVEIETNNTFIGRIFLEGDRGITKLRITLPNGEVEKVFIINARKKWVFGNKKYLEPIIWLKSGKWKFEISRIESYYYPDVFLLFADVKLP